MAEISFERKKSYRGKVYFLIITILIIAIISVAFYYFQKQIINQAALNNNLSINNINQEPTIIWQNFTHSQAGYQLKIPADWFTKEVGSDLLVTSYDQTKSIKPIKKAKLGIQLVNNPTNLTEEEWWQSFHQSTKEPDYTKETKEIIIDNELGLKKIMESPIANPLDLDYSIIVNQQKVIYVMTMITEGYAKNDYQEILEEMIKSFQFPDILPATLTLPLTTTTSTPPQLELLPLIYSGWQKYENQEQGFKIEYPANWHVYNEGSVPNLPDYWQIIFEDQKYTGQEIERPYIAVGILKNQNSLTDWFSLQKEALNEINILYNENYQVNDLEGIMYTSGGLGLSYNFATLFNNKIYRIWSLNFFPADDTLMIYFKMLDSFRLLPET